VLQAFQECIEATAFLQLYPQHVALGFVSGHKTRFLLHWPGRKRIAKESMMVMVAEHTPRGTRDISRVIRVHRRIWKGAIHPTRSHSSRTWEPSIFQRSPSSRLVGTGNEHACEAMWNPFTQGESRPSR